MTRRLAASILALLLLTPVLAACGSSEPSIAAASPHQSTLRRRTIDHSPAVGVAASSTAPPPSAVPTPAVAVKVGSIATVVSDDLRLRSRPEVSDASKKLEPLLQRGRHVFVVKGPVAGSGYRWYEVQPLGSTGDQSPGPFGWVAAADKTGEPWIKDGAFVCPKAPTTLQALKQSNH